MSGINNKTSVGPVIATIEELNDFQSMVEEELTDVILDTDEFAVNARFSFMTVNVPVFFSETGTLVDPDTGATVMSSTPMLRVAESSLTRKANESDYVNVKGVLYNIVTCLPDGAGMFDIALHKK